MDPFSLNVAQRTFWFHYRGPDRVAPTVKKDLTWEQLRVI